MNHNMLTRNLASIAPRRLLQRRLLSSSSEQHKISGGDQKSWFRRKAIPVVLLSLTGGIALSALNDLAIFHGCTTKAIEKASQNQEIIEALGEPIVRGPWYNATLAVGHRRHSVSCTFPVSGPQGSGIFQFKAIRTGEDSWFSFLRHHDWDVLILDALLHTPSNGAENQTMRISVTDNMPTANTMVDCKACKSPEVGSTGQ